MAKVITVSKTFPPGHINSGQPTYFIEKIYASLADNLIGFKIPNSANKYWDFHEYYNCSMPKHHTIRKGKRWKTGDLASLRVWGDDINPKTKRIGPYHSKQVILYSDIKVTVFDFEVINAGLFCQIKVDGKIIKSYAKIKQLANNDGLTPEELDSWFKLPKAFSGQIICWNSNIKY